MLSAQSLQAYKPTGLHVQRTGEEDEVYGEVLGHCSSVPLGALGLGALGSSQCIAEELEYPSNVIEEEERERLTASLIRPHLNNPFLCNENGAF